MQICFIDMLIFSKIIIVHKTMVHSVFTYESQLTFIHINLENSGADLREKLLVVVGHIFYTL